MPAQQLQRRQRVVHLDLDPVLALFQLLDLVNAAGFFRLGQIERPAAFGRSIRPVGYTQHIRDARPRAGGQVCQYLIRAHVQLGQAGRDRRPDGVISQQSARVVPRRCLAVAGLDRGLIAVPAGQIRLDKGALFG